MSRAGEQAAGAVATYLGAASVTVARSRSWFSATFAGERHRLLISATGGRRSAVQALSEADLPIASGFVADVAIGACSYDGCTTFATIELLTIEA